LRGDDSDEDAADLRGQGGAQRAEHPVAGSCEAGRVVRPALRSRRAADEGLPRCIQRGRHARRELIVAEYLTDGYAKFSSLQKISYFDIGLHSDVLIHERERVIGSQSRAIRELSTPVLQIRDRLLLLPLIGVIDSHRAPLITESLLRAILTARAKVVHRRNGRRDNRLQGC